MSTTTFNPAVTIRYSKSFSIASVFTEFINWCNGQEIYRLFWLGIIIGVHGCILTPLTVFILMYSGINLVMLFFAVLAMAICLIVNLAALPPKITIPVFILSAVIDLVIIIVCVLPG